MKRIMSRISLIGLSLLLCMLLVPHFVGAQQKVKLEYMTPIWLDLAYGQAWLDVADDYTKMHPNVTFEYNYVAYKDFFNQLVVRVFADKAPALAHAGYHTAEFVEADALVEMGPYLEKAGWTADDFWSSIWDLTIYKGKQWGVPFTLDTRVWFYNEDLHEKAGVNPPETWDDLLEIGPKIYQATGAYAYGATGITSADWCWVFGPWLYSNKGNWIVQDSEGLWVSNVTSPEVLETLEFGRKMVTDSIVPPGMANNDHNFNRGLFQREQVASFLSGPWEYGIFDDAAKKGEMNFEVGQILIPKRKVHASTSGGWSWYMFNTIEDPDTGWDVIDFFLKTENIATKEWPDSLPPTRDGMRVGKWAEDPRYELMMQALENSPMPVPVVANWYEIMDILWTYSMRVLIGEDTAENAMQEADSKVQNLLNKGQNRIILGEK